MTDRLVLDNLPVVYRLAGEMAGRCPGFDVRDLVAAGTVGLCDAAKRFKPRRGVAFASFAWLRVRGAMLDWMRVDGPYRRGQVQAFRRGELAPVLVPLEEAADVEDGTPGLEEILDTARGLAATRARVEALPANLRQLIGLMYGPRELDLPRAGKAMGLSKSWACRLRQQALGQLRDAAAA